MSATIKSNGSLGKMEKWKNKQTNKESKIGVMMICSAIKINWKNVIKMMMTWRLPLEQLCKDSCTHPQTYTGAKKCELVPNKAKAPSPGQTCWRLSCYFVENSKVWTKLTYEPETLPASRDFMCTTHQRSTVIQYTSVKQKNLFLL